MIKKSFLDRVAISFIVTFFLMALPACSSDSKKVTDSNGDDPPPDEASVIFLHHSTGGVIWNGGVASAIDDYNTLNGRSYVVTEEAYPNSPYPWANYPYDYWHLWVEDGGQADEEGIPTLESYTSSYDVVVFKHCYPVSGMDDNTGSPDIGSSSKRMENYQLQYAALKTRLRQYPETQFILWTGAALAESASSTEEGQLARAFFTWVKEDWDEPGDNIFLWDFFELETEGGNFLLEQYCASSGDSHPSSTFARTVAPLFAQRIIDVIEGNGDSGSITGE
ncbi:MAG: hypothetical protein JW814_01900 [Candidatus Krumholzibacteriota bacterium]|nr:hypothetical protein [Candidatus Krumholzibacteriota bacterium]